MSPSTKIELLVKSITNHILEPLIALLFAIAIVYFIWGVLKFIMNVDDTQAREEGRRHMVWGVVGIFIMVVAWGIINLINATIP